MTRFRRPTLSGLKNIVAAMTLAVFVATTIIPVTMANAATTTQTKSTQKSTVKKKTSTTKSKAKKPTTRKAAQPYNPRYASIVIDAASGAVLSESGADTSVHPASLTKMMTLLLAFERLENGTLSLNQRVPISNNAARQAPSKLGLPAGSSIDVKSAIYALVTKSANDISVALGEAIGGSEGHFVYLMNEKAKEIGMNRTRFTNPSGLHNPAQVTTARDFAKLSRYLVKNYSREYKYFSTRSFTYNGIANRNHNRLMETYNGMDGIKTGYILPSGFNLAASAVRNNHRLIAIVFGGKTSQTRNNEVASLLDNGFARLETLRSQALIAKNVIETPPLRAPGTTDPRLATTSGTADRRTPAVSLVPARKPGQVSPAVKLPPPQVTTLAAARPLPAPAPAPAAQVLQAPQTGTMDELAGQGDADPAVTRRFETGMMAISAIKGTLKAGETSSPPAEAAHTPKAEPVMTTTLYKDAGQDDWAIQLGSYNSRVKGDEVLNTALAKLPVTIKVNAKPVIVPLKAGDGWVYRARLHGLSREQASAACKYFNNCMAISPVPFKPPAAGRESGNMIFFILLAIFLIGLVTAALRSGGMEGANTDREDLSIKISQVRQNAAELEHALNLIMQNGISEADISFASPDGPSAYGVYNANPPAEIFNPKGGAATYRSAPSGVNDGSAWGFYGATALPEQGSDRPDLVAVLPHVTAEFCTQINASAGQSSQQPTDTGECVNGGPARQFIPGVRFVTSGENTMDTATFTNMPAPEACVRCDASGTTYNYYRLLMAR